MQLEEDFKGRLGLARDIFGDRVFRFKDDKGEWQLSKPLYDGVMVALDRLWPKRDRLLSTRTKIVKRVARQYSDRTREFPRSL